MTVCTMYEIYIKFILNCVTKWTGMEPETDFVIASIVGTGKSIDFFYLLGLAITPYWP